MDKVLNLELMRHPANWIVVTLMFLFASLAIRFVMSAASLAPPTPVNS